MEISEKICFLIVYSPAVGDHGTYSYGVVRVLDSYWNRGSNGWLHGYGMENLQYEINVNIKNTIVLSCYTDLCTEVRQFCGLLISYFGDGLCALN